MNRWLELLKNNDYISIKKYINNGANLEDKNDVGEGILTCALRSRCDDDILHLLIENGADIFACDDEGVSVFDTAITYDNLEMVKFLVAQNYDINNTKRKSGFTPLMASACYGRLEIAKFLLENGADKRLKDTKGFSAIDFARKMNKKSILKLFDYDETDEKNIGYAR